MNKLSGFLISAVFAALSAANAQVPEWIWHDNKGQSPAENEIRFFRKTFDLPGPVTKALLTVAGDDEATVFINGKQVALNRGWNKPTWMSVGQELKPGKNVVAIRGKNAKIGRAQCR